MEQQIERQMECQEEKAYLYWLMKAPFLGAVSIRKIAGHVPELSGILNIEETELVREGVLTGRQAGLLTQWRETFSACREEYLRLDDQGIRLVSASDPEYPERLLEICDYPAGLFVKGQLPGKRRPMAAIVGARGCSAYGEQLAFEFAKLLAKEGIGIVSGLALGIDGSAHAGALKADGYTCGVLGCGANICYPPSNYRLYQEMAGRGAVISEFVPDTPPMARNFPMRNRIISGMADVVLVVEAKEKSGSLITADLAAEQGKEVFAVPGRVTDHLSRGCNLLIQQGAHMAISPNDISEHLGLKLQKELQLHEKNVNGLAKKEKMVYSCLDFKPKHLDEIAAESGMAASECMGILLELELGGYAYRSANHYYGKTLSD